MAEFCHFSALDLLAEQHAEIDKLFQALERKRRNRRELLVELTHKLLAHATIEEKLFYPHIMSGATSELLHEAVEDHLKIKRMLAELFTMDLDAGDPDAKISALKEHVFHHTHEEEEAKLFPLVREAMNAYTLTMLGYELMVMFEHLMAVEPRKQVLQESAQAAPLLA